LWFCCYTHRKVGLARAKYAVPNRDIRLALLLVTSALNGTTENPDFKETAKLIEMSEGGLRKKVDNIGFKTVSQA